MAENLFTLLQHELPQLNRIPSTFNGIRSTVPEDC